jgi:hypothetical protein
MANLDNIHVHLIQSFWSLAIFMKTLLLQFQESILYAEDCDKLRDQGVLSPINSPPDKVHHYASGPISTTCKLEKYLELESVDKYREYVLFGCLACPSIVADPDILELFKLVAKTTLFIDLYRDMVSLSAILIV